MLRKKSVVFTAMMFAIVALFVATEGTATATGGGSIPCEEIITPGEIVQDEEGDWIYKFNIDKEALGYWDLDQLEFAFDSSLGVEGINVSVELRKESVGGDHPKNFGEDFPGRRIAIIETEDIPSIIELRVTGASGNFGDTGVHTRIKKQWWYKWYKKDDTCQVDGPIPGSIAQQTPEDDPECVALDTRVSLLVRRGADACAKDKVVAYANPKCAGEVMLDVDPEDRDPKLLYSGPPGQNTQCRQESVDVEQVNSPFYYYTYRSGGNRYEFCIDLSDGTLVDIDECL